MNILQWFNFFAYCNCYNQITRTQQIVCIYESFWGVRPQIWNVHLGCTLLESTIRNKIAKRYKAFSRTVVVTVIWSVCSAIAELMKGLQNFSLWIEEIFWTQKYCCWTRGDLIVSWELKCRLRYRNEVHRDCLYKKWNEPILDVNVHMYCCSIFDSLFWYDPSRMDFKAQAFSNETLSTMVSFNVLPILKPCFRYA